MPEHHTSFNDGNPIFNCRNALVLTAVDLGCVHRMHVYCSGCCRGLKVTEDLGSRKKDLQITQVTATEYGTVSMRVIIFGGTHTSSAIIREILDLVSVYCVTV